MKKDKKKQHRLQIQVDLHKQKQYYFVKELSNVFFPFQPYPEQINVVKEIQAAIYNQQNMIIESPTGTGKTICLLVGAISSLIGQSKKKKIYYLTRTHSQISQIVQQFNKTVYSCNLNIIASREQLCINRNLSQLKGKPLEKACEQLCVQKLCNYREFTHTKIPKPMELQDFKQFCRKDLICPYFYSKQLTQKCEITVLPFNYLLDWNLFQKNLIDLKDSVIIFDEAHNIDSICQQGSDIRLTADIVYQAIGELKNLIKMQSKRNLHKQFKDDPDECQEVIDMKTQIEMLMNRLKGVEESVCFSRNYFIQKMEEFTTCGQIEGLDLGNYFSFCAKGKKIAKIFFKKQLVCEYFLIFLQVIEKIYSISTNQEQFRKFSITLAKGQIFFRCLDPSLCFKRIVETKPRTIILSSGTMGNLDTWEKNMQIPFAYKLTTQSFITSNQLYAQVKGKSQNGVSFNFSFQGKQNQKQYEEICKQLKILENIIKGGIVVAFSNYDLMERTLKYSHILGKKIYFETKGGNVQDIYQQYSDEANKKGAILFIIMKGRFSEGINFSNQLCRCLVIVGIPFLPLKDPGIVQKMKFLQNNYTRNQADQWYIQQSFKSLNQTLGRAIRNKDDFSVILLMDQRYSKEENIKHLSKWFINCLRKQNSAYADIKQFMQNELWKNRTYELKKLQQSTKNKSQPKICERLHQFSTPSKSDCKKLRFIIQSDQKLSSLIKTEQKVISPQKKIQLKQIYVNEEPSYNKMSKQLVDFFLKSQQTACETSQKVKDGEQLEQNSQYTIQPPTVKLAFMRRSFGKIKDSLDF